MIPARFAGELMKRFVSGVDRGQSTLLPECLDDFIDESNPVRAIDAFVDATDLAEFGFDGVESAATGRPSYHPSVLLKLYVYGYLNCVQSSRRLEREAGRTITLGSPRSSSSVRLVSCSAFPTFSSVILPDDAPDAAAQQFIMLLSSKGPTATEYKSMEF